MNELNKSYSLDNRKRDSILSDFGWDKPDQINKINRFKIRHPDEVLENAVGYVFMVRPDLNIISNSTFFTRPEFADFRNNNKMKNILNNLEITKSTDNGFINLITNYSENFDLSDDVMKTGETAAAFMGWSMQYGGMLVDSRKADTFSISFEDDKDLSLYKLHYTWIEYINLVKKGLLVTKREYITNRVIDYMTSLFFFLVAEDGERIVYGAKYIGVFPTNIPNSALSWNKGNFSQPKYSITYQYNFREDMRLSVISTDFNEISKIGKTKRGGDPIRDDISGRSNTYWVSNAHIEKQGNHFKLLFTK